MPVFEYVGIDQQRKKAQGIIEADNDRTARMRLRKMGIFPQSLTLEGRAKAKISLSTNVDFSRFTQRIKTQDIAQMTRQLATLVNAGIPLVESLTALVDQIENPKLKKVISQVREKVTEGMKMSDAMRAHPKVFGDLYVNMVNAGENSGALDVVLVRLADFTEGQARLKSKIIGAMIYPAIMSIVGVFLMIALVVFVVPKITQIFEDVQATLPLPTKILMGVSDALTTPWVIILILILIPLAIYGVKRWLKTPKGREFWDRRMLKVPLFGKLNRMVAISRFSRTLSTLLNSGVPLLNALDIVRNIVTNTIIRRAIEETRTSVQEGASVSDPLKKSGEFPPIVTHMIAIGEKTGDLEKMLERIAEAYDAQVDNTVSTLTTLLEPIMILVMASIVSFIVMSILLPILQLNQLGT
ncbi:MAG: type II secretion system protein GspF [Deltaproteobacteria bacterium RIFCSPLOWO2_12_FULL_44_12]|nr:MAG: type II secretion system protein GspF [Deltaproteobacteria bacterium RIFCSPHIGHO2_01_FULL_43_49]OGQ16198.1 MAG: type II secretion system protein GspF [Deltaproteobacteria bacterium RIFCSPHIGHO2_02_FULL_44_53]OGQ29158.1 MAG: type II secretion system protein GspF [Deltaproteobacteria bacterium RIFCSPHIGHO2_12_FULL_44_21]OGQ32715.1 MAG: type II secretion system protein GspF [Deltaproteobacteria bacterium RIFCSPLOWO2_01_FULL_45_74]OGQ41817.1 MAG: type II secretion system protein GspF [Delta